MSPRRGRMPRPKAKPKPLAQVQREVAQRMVEAGFAGPKPGVGLTYPPETVSTPAKPQAVPAPESIAPLPETDIGQPGDRAKAILTPGEGIYGMLSWLSSRVETLEVGVNHDPSDLAALADEFCLANAIHRPKSRTWHKKVVIPGAAEREAVRPTPPPVPELPREDPGDRQERMAKIRAGLRERGPVEHAKAPEQFSTFDGGDKDLAGKTSGDRVSDLAAGMHASPPSSFSGGGPPVPFDS